MRLSLVLVLVLFSSCASFKEQSCNTQGAYNLGQSHAKSWKANQAKVLMSQCSEAENYSSSSFSKDYTVGYMAQMNLQCNQGEVEAKRWPRQMKVIILIKG